MGSFAGLFALVGSIVALLPNRRDWAFFLFTIAIEFFLATMLIQLFALYG